MNASAIVVVLLITNPDGTPALRFETALVSSLSKAECSEIGQKLSRSGFRVYPTGHGISVSVVCEAVK